MWPMQRCHWCGKLAWKWGLARHFRWMRKVIVESHLCEFCWLEMK